MKKSTSTTREDLAFSSFFRFEKFQKKKKKKKSHSLFLSFLLSLRVPEEHARGQLLVPARREQRPRGRLGVEAQGR